MSDSSIEISGGQLQDFTIDQFAGATALILASAGGLLLTIWKSRCACRMRLGFSDTCYIFDCERKPPTEADSSDEEQPKPIKPKGSIAPQVEQLIPANEVVEPANEIITDNLEEQNLVNGGNQNNQ